MKAEFASFRDDNFTIATTERRKIARARVTMNIIILHVINGYYTKLNPALPNKNRDWVGAATKRRKIAS